MGVDVAVAVVVNVLVTVNVGVRVNIAGRLSAPSPSDRTVSASPASGVPDGAAAPVQAAKAAIAPLKTSAIKYRAPRRDKLLLSCRNIILKG